MASEAAVHADKPHDWHMARMAELAAADPELLLATEGRVVDLAEPRAVEDAVAWWETLTDAGGEGMVAKPLDFFARGKKGLLQPAIKCRGREYLRIIYGPDYTLPEHLDRLRERGLGAKRGLAVRESDWASKRSTDSRGASRSAACMSACSRCWRWRANRWMPDCRRRIGIG